MIILGKVYNVKEYMSKHPGGQDILLGVMGKDATVEFETMRHSELALKQLEQLLVGSYDTSAPAQRRSPRSEGEENSHDPFFLDLKIYFYALIQREVMY